MIQTIGIEFRAQGYERVTRSLRAIQISIQRLIAKVGELDKALMTISVGKLFAVFSQQAIPIDSATAALIRYNQQLTQAVGLMGRLKPLGNIGGKIEGKREKKRPSLATPSVQRAAMYDAPWLFAAMPYVMRWALTSALLYGGGKFAKDTLLGGARREYAKELQDLGVIGLSREQITLAEKNADKFISSFWQGGEASDFMRAMANIGSAFDINESTYWKNTQEGALSLQKMSEHAMVMGAASRMKADEAAALISKVIHGQLISMPAGERKAYETGEKKVADLSERIAASIGMIIKYTSAWGTDIGNALSYSLASALQKGMSVETLQALSGMLVTANIKGQKAGRALKSFFEKGPEGIASTMMAGAPDMETFRRWEALSGQDRKELARKYALGWERLFIKNPIGTMKLLGEYSKRAAERGYGPHKFFGLEFAQIVRMMQEPGFLKRWKEVMTKLGPNPSMQQVLDTLKVTMGDSGYWLNRISAEWEAIKRTLGRMSRESTTVSSMVESVISYMRSWRDWLNTSTLSAVNEFQRQKAIEKFAPIKTPYSPWTHSFLMWWGEKSEKIMDYLSEIQVPLKDMMSDIWNDMSTNLRTAAWYLWNDLKEFNDWTDIKIVDLVLAPVRLMKNIIMGAASWGLHITESVDLNELRQGIVGMITNKLIPNILGIVTAVIDEVVAAGRWIKGTDVMIREKISNLITTVIDTIIDAITGVIKSGWGWATGNGLGLKETPAPPVSPEAIGATPSGPTPGQSSNMPQVEYGAAFLNPSSYIQNRGSGGFYIGPETQFPQSSNGGPINIADNITLNSTLVVDNRAIAHAVDEAMRLRQVGLGHGFGDYLELGAESV